MKKSKIVFIISIGFTACILTATMVTQFKTVEETDITGIEIMREAELRTELASWKNKLEEADIKIEETDQKIEEYSKEIENNNNISELLQREVAEANKYAGYTDLMGPGIVVTLEDTDDRQIDSSDIIYLINELKAAGAEAISVGDSSNQNSQRVIALTDISNIDYKFILINTAKEIGMSRVSSPYVIRAIGNQRYLESSISIKYGFIDSMESNDKKVSYVLDNNVFIPRYEGNLDFKYAKEASSQ